jgi:hypothetical protein
MGTRKHFQLGEQLGELLAAAVELGSTFIGSAAQGRQKHSTYTEEMVRDGACCWGLILCVAVATARWGECSRDARWGREPVSRLCMESDVRWRGGHLALRGGMATATRSHDVGMENWASEYDRLCWNESNPEIRSPLFVPKGNWTEADFERARQHPANQDEISQTLIEREYRRLRGLPQTFDPAVEDPWDGMRGEGGASYWGQNPLENIPGGTDGLRNIPALRQMLQGLYLQVKERQQTADAMYVVTALEALQQLRVCDLGSDAQTLFPLQEDEWRGPQFVSEEQREQAVGLLIKSLADFLAPDYLPPAHMSAPRPKIDPPGYKSTLDDTPVQIHVPEACRDRARSKGVLPGMCAWGLCARRGHRSCVLCCVGTRNSCLVLVLVVHAYVRKTWGRGRGDVGVL